MTRGRITLIKKINIYTVCQTALKSGIIVSVRAFKEKGGFLHERKDA